ncbi:MAG: 3-hydroxyacyl-ACP dehydratase FabZ [Proteobacteria bacterium]|nr:3-hydroxyacyl-ACP dehydratase FabZ [Pseudomonadota bacterium]
MKTAYDIQKIMEFLPHRYPFLLVDRVIELVPGDKIIALKNVTINEPFFQGHFPVQPVMPGVLIIEAMAQAGGLLAYESSTADNHGQLIYFMGMDKVRFRKPVVPGDQLIIESKILRMRTKVAKMAGTATVDNQLVAEAELMASFGESK